MIDNTMVGTYSNNELGAGVNVAVIANTPQQLVSKAIYDKILAKNSIEQNIRDLRFVESNIGIVSSNVSDWKAKLDAYMSTPQFASTPNTDYTKSKVLAYEPKKIQEVTYLSNLLTANNDVYTVYSKRTYSVSILKD